jgi:tRNA(Arg) A34 adenosine deaminase TadA
MIKYIPYDSIVNPSRATVRRMEKTIALARLSAMSQKHGAILYSGGRLVSLGVNVQRNTTQSHISPLAMSYHAEVNVIRGLNLRYKPATGTLYVARISKGGNIAHSRPCRACQMFLETYTSISKVIHT